MHNHAPPVIRPATPSDVPAMAALLGELFAVETDFTPDPAAQRRGLGLLFSDPTRGCALVAEATGEVVGMVTVQTLISTAEGGPVGLVEDLVVTDRWRGRGLGTALIDAVEEWARQRGLLRLQLLADRENQAGLAFYGAQKWDLTCLVCLRRKPV